ncbi:DUF4304 domain-containing protein [Plantibacter sp. Mn2098]|uniref:DUF4304 domain-containing protein n=1 Tax=Plantibacter sp. Mn2098 TaxID=3395266 RepID=UPI003BDDCC29
MSTHLEERFDSLVSEVVTTTLKPLGYRKKQLVWTRATDAAVHRIVLQRSQGNTANHLRFYVELSAFVPAFARAIGHTVPADPTKATPPYTRRFESVAHWPSQWVDLEEWEDADLNPALETALRRVDAHLAEIVTADALADALRTRGPLNVDLFAWSLVTGDTAAVDGQIAAARAQFGAEDRWPRLFAQFERTAARHGVVLDAIA